MSGRESTGFILAKEEIALILVSTRLQFHRYASVRFIRIGNQDTQFNKKAT